MEARACRGGGAGRGSEGGEEKEAPAWRRGGEGQVVAVGREEAPAGGRVGVGSAPLAGRRAPRTA